MITSWSRHKLPLISVIIPTFNAKMFLPRAIESVLGQTYKYVELVIIDDGSVDDTFSVIQKNDVIKYVYQKNSGLSSARNKGVEKSNGTYLVFLDADDWLQPDALQQNYSMIKNKPDVAFVSGNYYLKRASSNSLESIAISVFDNHYIRLLKSNYIGMHAAVMFQRWVFQEFRYDETLKACEDYDLYLNITRNYPVIHHDKFIATYYFHPLGLSHNYRIMMNSIATVIEKQLPYLQSSDEKAAYLEGSQQWKDYYMLMKQSS